jgi:hypothetical protein
MFKYIQVVWTYTSWLGMHHRCYHENHSSYKDYVERGIKVCGRWHGDEGFDNFIEDVGIRPARNYSIDRIDVNGNYEPTNCRWADAKQQANNTRKNRYIVVNGEKGTISEMAIKYGIHKERIRARLEIGWTPEEACTIGINQQRSNDVIITYNGISKRLSDYVREFDIEFSTLRHRIKKGWTVEQALTTPVKRIFTVFGETESINYLSEKFGIRKSTIYERLREGWSIEDALTTPVKECKLYTAFGETGTVSCLCKKFNISRDAVFNRLKNGMSIDALKGKLESCPPKI